MREATTAAPPEGVGHAAAPSSIDARPPPETPVPARVTITVEGHGHVAATSAERVLVALERGQGFGLLKGLPRRLPVGCRRGGCGICRARVLEGTYERAPMSRSHVSVEDEAAGIVLACAIYARSDLTLRLETPALGKNKGAKPVSQVVQS